MTDQSLDGRGVRGPLVEVDQPVGGYPDARGVMDGRRPQSTERRGHGAQAPEGKECLGGWTFRATP